LSKKSVASLIVVAALALAASPARAELQWSDNSFRYWYGSAFREPANPNNVAKNVFGFTHVDGYKWGGNFLGLSLLYSSLKDPVRNVGNEGAAEVYAVYRHTLSFNKVGNTKMFSFGPVRDVGFVLGVDANTKNHQFESRKIMPTGGLQLAFAVPGFLTVDFLLNKEWAINGINGRSVEFDVTPMLAAAWGIPLYGPVAFEGYGSMNLPKGKDGFNADTKTEILLHPKLMVDIGTLWGSKGYQLGVGYQWWMNKFGNDHDAVGSRGGAYERAIFGEVAIHL